MSSAYITVIGLALTGFLLMVVRAAAGRLLALFYPVEVLDCTPLRVANAIVVTVARYAGALAAVLAVVCLMTAGT